MTRLWLTILALLRVAWPLTRRLAAYAWHVLLDTESPGEITIDEAIWIVHDGYGDRKSIVIWPAKTKAEQNGSR